jgi:hypothetical protein
MRNHEPLFHFHCPPGAVSLDESSFADEPLAPAQMRNRASLSGDPTELRRPYTRGCRV